MPAPDDSLIAARIDPDTKHPGAWDLFASCDRYYWNRAGRVRRREIKARLAPHRRAAVAVSIRAREFLDARNALENLSGSAQLNVAGSAQVHVCGWTCRGDECYVLLSVVDPLPAEAIASILAVSGIQHMEPDRDRTARSYWIEPDASTLFDACCERIDPVRPATLFQDELEAQEAIKGLELPVLDGQHDGKPHTVAIIDNGLEWRHPYVAPHLWINDRDSPANCEDDDRNGLVNDRIGWNFYCNSPDPQPYNFWTHGTQIAGLITAVANRAGAPVRIMAIRADGPASRLSLSGLAGAVEYASRQGANSIVIAQSWSLNGGDPHEASQIATFQEAVRRAGERGALLVCAAGNLRKDIDVLRNEPAVSGLALDNVLTVQGVGPWVCNSNYSSSSPDQLVVAPAGMNIRSISTMSTMAASFDQTSAAAAIVAGVCAVVATCKRISKPGELKSCLRRCRNPAATDPADLEARLLNLRYLP